MWHRIVNFFKLIEYRDINLKVSLTSKNIIILVIFYLYNNNSYLFFQASIFLF